MPANEAIRPLRGTVGLQRLKKQVTIRLGVDVIEYFQQLASETGIPYQTLINLYLRDCAVTGRKPAFKWAS